MFTGIITDIGTILAAEPQDGLTLTVGCGYDPGTLAIGESIACNGVCLTVVEIGHGPASFTVQLSPETLARTAPQAWQLGGKLNLERALQVGDRLGGHFVTGHVDGLAVLERITPMDGSYGMELGAPAELARFIAEKGSVTLEGVSLTVNAVEGERFTVNIIPHTWEKTTLGMRNAGDALHLEIDMIARYLGRLKDYA